MKKNTNHQIKTISKTTFSILLSLIIFSCPFKAISAMLVPDPEYVGFIQQKINSYSVYPPEANNKGWEGVVKIKFTIAQDGRIKSMDIAETSGYPLLDAAAMMAVKDASPYPFPDIYTGNKEVDIVIPVTFKKSHGVKTVTLGNLIPDKKAPESLPPQQQYPLLPLDQRIKAESSGKPQEPAPLTEQGILAPKAQPEKFDLTGKFKDIEPKKHAIPATMFEELNDMIDIALLNNQPTKIAQEEVELAQLKVNEAKRNLYPNLKFSAYTTDGEVFKVGYREREAKIQVDHPVYSGGVFQDTLDQSLVNLKISEKNYDRLKLDVVQKAETAYYNLVAARMQLHEKEALFKEANDLMGKINQLAAIEMVIPLEVNSSKSWFNQLEFQMKSIQQDIYMAETTLKQILNTSGTPKVNIQILEAKPLDLYLDTCIEAALMHRPEIYLSELLVKFNDYGQKIEKDKDKLNITFETSYGKYQGAYKTEKMKNSDNWYAGLKATKPWGGNTVNSSLTHTRSQPKFGETSPTAGTTLSAEFTLLDNLKRYSEKKKADIDLVRALSDLNESAKTIAFEVQDAFLNYQKAVLQLNTSSAEMKFRRNEAEVIRVRAMVGETSLSNAMEALYSFSDAQTKYIQALASYYISLANLKKATGYGIKL